MRRPPLPPGPWLVVGLARSGIAALEVLSARGEQARGVDRRQGDDTPAALEHVRAVVKSPGVPAEAPVIAAARERGLPVLGEVELAWRLIPNEFIAVTGTNGKTTTTELIGHIHREAARPAAVAGNVGTALSSLVGHLAPDATVVCEVSSFQLEDAVEFAPEGAVLLNLAPDHIDRHGTFEAYTAAKLRVFAHQGNDDVAVAPLGLGVEDLGGCARRVCFGDGPQAELSDRAGQLWWGEEPLIAVEDLTLRGLHNRRNAMAAAAICLARGIEPDAVRSALRTFGGVEHRLEEVATVDGVRFVNDSQGTQPDAVVAALEAFEAPVVLIAGGRDKAQRFEALAAAARGRVKAAILIGEGRATSGPALRAVTRVEDAESMGEAVRRAAALAAPGDVVLLSPACASFDMFRDYEHRGAVFTEEVRALPEP